MSLILAPVTITRDHFRGYLHNDLWDGPPVTGRISSPQGIYRPSYGTVHQAIDIAAPHGTDIVAPADGTVTYVHDNISSPHPLGNFVLIRHENNWHTLYSHMDRGQVDVLMGDSIKRGQRFARIGVTGNTTGPHLHFGVAPRSRGFYFNSPYLRNPERFIRADDPLRETDLPPTNLLTRQKLAINAYLNRGLTPVRVEYVRGYERHLYKLLIVKGKVTY